MEKGERNAKIYTPIFSLAVSHPLVPPNCQTGFQSGKAVAKQAIAYHHQTGTNIEFGSLAAPLAKLEKLTEPEEIPDLDF
jgi:hypothetical protein